MIKKTLFAKALGFFSFFAILFFLTGCSAHSPFILVPTTDTHHKTTNKFQAHENKVFLTKESLPPGIEFEEIAQIEVGKVWYGSPEGVYKTMADRARKLGADAVIEIATWHQPAGFSWAAPQGSGKAIKLIDRSSVDFSMEGQWQ